MAYKKITGTIIKTKFLLLFSIVSITPAIAGAYFSSSKSKLTFRIAKTRGYQNSNNSGNIVEINKDSENDLYITLRKTKILDNSSKIIKQQNIQLDPASKDSKNIKFKIQHNQEGLYEVSIYNE